MQGKGGSVENDQAFFPVARCSKVVKLNIQTAFSGSKVSLLPSILVKIMSVSEISPERHITKGKQWAKDKTLGKINI